MSQRNQETAVARRRLQEIERQIRNCTTAIASMGLSNSLRGQLSDLEDEHQKISDELQSFEPHTLKSRLRNTRRFVEANLRNLHSMLNDEPRLVRAEIAKHVQKITLTPDGRTYIASGTWDLLGSVAARMVPGAGIAPQVQAAAPRTKMVRVECQKMLTPYLRQCSSLVQLPKAHLTWAYGLI